MSGHEYEDMIPPSLRNDIGDPYVSDDDLHKQRLFVVKRNVVNGCYDPEWISLDRIRKAYR